jgi:uroporphyrinogen decarboxylase
MRKLSSDRLAETLAPVVAAIAAVRRELPQQVALFGFAGAPWTVASYMVEGRGGSDFAAIKAWAYGEPDSFGLLIDLLVDATSAYLIRQVEAGAEVLQIFDSWAGMLSPDALERWALRPTAEIVRRVKAKHPSVPIVVFPRAVGASYGRYAAACGCDGLSLDTGVPPEWAATTLQPTVAVQGNLDPLVLVNGGSAMRDEAAHILEGLAGGPFVFNLGHGILPQTPPEHVAALCEFVHGWKRR